MNPTWQHCVPWLLLLFIFPNGIQSISYFNNSITMKEGGFINLVVTNDAENTQLCNSLGCLDFPNITFAVGEEADKYIKPDYQGNYTLEYLSSSQLSCEVVNPEDTMMYWIKADAFLNDTALQAEGKLIENIEGLDKPYELTLQNVTRRQTQGTYLCLLLNKKVGAIATRYVEVYNDTSTDPTDNYGTGWLGSLADGRGLNPQTSGIIAAATLLVIAIITIIAITIYRRQRQVIVKYWMKKITIEKPVVDENDPNSQGLQMPIVRIEKQRLTQMGIKGNDYTLMSEYQLPVDNRWEILRTNMSLTSKVLGEGEFGKVVKAECRNLEDSEVKTVVAVKMLKDGHSDADMIALVSELEIMKMIGKHENIINLLGCCTQDGPLYVIVEYARNGCLRSYLKNNKANKKSSSYDDLMSKKLTKDDLVDFTLQVAKGMEYLASRGCIHRDMAARNVLVSDRRVLKIADFGLARDVRDTDYYRKKTAGKLPARWMAPESLSQCMYTKQSDVWSYGVLMWEIMTMGNTPYPNVPVHYLYYYLKTGNRLEKPSGCSLEIYSTMKHCWSFDPEDRPSFTDLVHSLKKIIDPNYEPEQSDVADKTNDFLDELMKE